jgi:hypothetical protein
LASCIPDRFPYIHVEMKKPERVKQRLAKAVQIAGAHVLGILLPHRWPQKRRAIFKEEELFGMGFAKFLRLYLIVLVISGTLAQIKFHDAFAPGMYIASSLGRLTGEAIGASLLPTLIGLLVELVTTRKFEGRITLYVSLTIMLFSSLTDWLGNNHAL